jgi:hypothetical protein
VYTIKYFIKREFILLLIVFIVFINPFFYGSRLGLFFLIFIFFKSDKFSFLLDRNVFYLFLFSLTYAIFSINRIDNPRENGILGFVSDILVPFSVYLVGKYVSYKYRNIQVYLFTLFFLSFSFSIIPMFSIFEQIMLYGFLEGSRNMYLIWDRNILLSATSLGSFFLLNISALGLITVKKSTKFERRLSLLFYLIFVFSLVCVFRLGNRTQIVLSIVSLFFALISNLKNKSPYILFINSLSFITVLFYLFYNTNLDFDLFRFYSDRIEKSDEFGINSAGGRTDRWIRSIQSIVTDPFGWEFVRLGHAHNFWLDVARVSGIIPLIFLMFFTFSAFNNWNRVLIYFKNKVFIKTYIYTLFISFILQFSVEPIMEGMYLLFLLFCFFVGLLSGVLQFRRLNFRYS